MRLSLTALVVVALAGLAAGLLLAQGSGAENGVVGRPGVLSSGSFHSIAWPTEGRAAIVRQADGRLVLRLTRFETHEAPELYIYTAKQGEQRKVLAELRSPAGNQEYSMPADAARKLRVQVIIWCEACRRVWGEAKLSPAGSTMSRS
jgi:hypothetical protein